jgi:hypothetical protein
MKIYRLVLEALHKLQEIKSLEKSGELTNQRARAARLGIWKEVGCDAHTGFVIVAPGERHARDIAAARAVAAGEPDERASRWLDPKKTRCEAIGEAGVARERIVLASFRNG